MLPSAATANDGLTSCLAAKLGIHSLNGNGSGDGGKPNPPQPDLATRAAQALCGLEATTTGKTAFLAKYGTTDACVKGNLAAATAAVQACQASTAGNDALAACIRAKLGIPADKPKTDSSTAPANAAQQLASVVCQQEAAAIGKTAFFAKYGTPETYGNCIKQALPAVQAALAACTGATGGVSLCVFAKLGVTAPKGDGHGGTNDGHGGSLPQNAAQQIATAVCRQEAATIGKTAFVAKYGTPETYGNCVKQTLPAVQSAIDACTGGTGSVTACIGGKLGLTASHGDNHGSTTGQGQGDNHGSTGGGSLPAGAARTIALTLCQQEASALGKDAFVAKYGTPETYGNCATKRTAEAQAIIDSCATAASVSDCVRGKLGTPPPPSTSGGKDGTHH